MYGRLLIGVIVVVASLAVACTTKKDDNQTPTPAGATIAATPEGSLAPTATLDSSAADADAALAAVTDIIERANDARCPPPLTMPCNILYLDPANSGGDFDHGLGSFIVKENGVADATIVVGRMPNGQWFQYLWGNPLYHPTPTYQPATLPATVTICAFGNDAKVYSGTNPSSSEVGTLTDGASVSAEQFVLTQPASIGDAAVNKQGYGWYRVAEPGGWVYSKYVAAGPGCELHDELERP